MPSGTPPAGFRFPLRNRILAALGDVVVVVESRHAGGSLHTVDEAADRGITVMAVPGSPRNPASAGTNRLLIDGAPPVLGPEDVLVALGFARPEGKQAARSASVPVAADEWALELLGADQVDLDTLVRNSGRDLVDVVAALGRLEAEGLVLRRGAHFERVRRSAKGQR